MREQETGGKIFFIDGTGAWGNPTPQNVAYGAAKRAITQVKVSNSQHLLPARGKDLGCDATPGHLLHWEEHVSGGHAGLSPGSPEQAKTRNIFALQDSWNAQL